MNTPSRTTAHCAAVVHGGAGNSQRNQDGCVTAARRAIGTLRAAQHATDAVVAAVTSLEDDGRFNAGRGASLRLDRLTIEMDASVMNSDGLLGAVAAVRDVRNPIQLARAVADTPHRLLAGEGAIRFARTCGMAHADHDLEGARQEYDDTLAQMRRGDPVLPGVDNDSLRHLWNYAVPWQEAVARHGSGTVGAVARDAQGRFAVATSTGGSMPALLGRVGDTPLIGCGFYCGEHGAVGATGVGEHIISSLLAYRVYGWIVEGVPLQEALDRGVSLFDPGIDIGLIGVTAHAAATSSNRSMPVAIEFA